MKKAITDWQERGHKAGSELQGFALACVGTKRSAYWAFGVGGWTYHESEARVFDTREEAAKVMTGAARDMFKYTMLVPVIMPNRLPTIHGY